ncbi:MAG: uroporphyrinogen-III C-methyltransferase [Acidobacteriota bacterium]
MGQVFIIGAGPGDPGLLTARGVRLLAQADVVVYDRETEAVLRWARPDAERIVAGGPAERETAQDAISMLIAEKARDGHVVARLKWGDPFVFDSGAKEAMFLHEQGVSFEVVPGVPAAIGMPAYAGIPVTHPGGSDVLVLIRGREDSRSEPPDLDWEALGRLDATIVCYTDGRLASAVLRQLMDHGMPEDTAAALITQGTLPSQQTVTGTLQSLCELAAADLSTASGLLIVGEVTNLRDHLRWFDERPLFGRRVVVTRSQEQAQELIDELENLGAQTIQAPTFRVTPPDDPEALDRAAASVDDYDWVIFESANAVTRFLSALSRGPRDVRALGDVRICAIGPSAADRLIAGGLKPDIVVAEFGGEGVGEMMHAMAPLTDAHVLILRPDHVRGVIGDDLNRRGAAVDDLVVYRTAPAASDSPAAQSLYRTLLDGQVDAVTFTSATAVRRFAALIGEEQATDLLNTTTVVAIGPVTAAAAREMGIENVLVPDSYTVSGLVQVLVEHFSPAAVASVR